MRSADADSAARIYLANNPNGYRCHSTTGLPFPVEALQPPG
jgi:hypothetical protein